MLTETAAISQEVPKSHRGQRRGKHRRPEGGATWVSLPPLEFENDDVICCSHGKYPKIFARAFGARIKYPYIESKTPKKSRKFSFAPSARRKIGHFC